MDLKKDLCKKIIFRKTSLESRDGSRTSRDLFAHSEDSNSRSAQTLITNKAENPFKRMDRPTTVAARSRSPSPEPENTENKENDKSSILDGLNKPEVKRSVGPKSMREKLANLRKNQKKTAQAERNKKTQSKIQFGKRKLSDDDSSQTEKKLKTPVADLTPPVKVIKLEYSGYAKTFRLKYSRAFW